MKYKIEKNTVQETLILPLYSRKLCTELYPNLYQDETAVHLIDQIDYDFSEAEKNSRSLMQRFGALEVAMRQNDLAWEVRAYLKTHPCAAVVNLGCGLDNTGRACDNGRCKIYNLDFPDVIALRQQLLPAGEREQNIPCDLKDPAWFDKIDASGGAVFFASGVFYYFLTEQVKALVQGMADAFPGGVLVFDAANRTAVKMIAKTWLRTAKIKDVGAYFAVSDAKSELSPWDRAFPMGQPFASVQPGLYDGLQRSERPVRQRLFPISRQGRGQRDENADREDRIWRQRMKYAGMPFGMWVLFAGSFQKQLTAVLGYDADTARAITKKAKPQYRQIIRRLPEFEKADRFKMNIVNCAMLGAFILSVPQRPEVDRLTDYYAKSMMTKPMQWFCRKSGKSKFTPKDIAAMKATATLKAADRNPYSWNMEFYEYPDGSGYEGRFTKCGICVLMKELGLYDLTPALCHLDYTMSEAGGVTNFVRQYTLASGGPYCDCGYKKKG